MEAGLSKVVIVGGGVAALEAALALQELAEELVDVELVAPDQNFVYRPLLVAEPFGAGQVRTFPMQRLAEAAGAGFTEAIVTGVDSDRAHRPHRGRSTSFVRPPAPRTGRRACHGRLGCDLLPRPYRGRGAPAGAVRRRRRDD